MKIVKEANPHALQHFEAARLSNFATALLVSVGKDGKLLGEVSEEFVLSGLLGFNRISVIIFGVVASKDGFSVQQLQVQDPVIESFLGEHLRGIPGLQSVEYTRHIVDDGEIAIAILGWNWATKLRVREALGANFTPQSWNMLISDQNKIGKNRSLFSTGSLAKYVELRRSVAPNALELRFDTDRLPALLGLHQERPTLTAAVAAFGNNGGVSPAVYIRSGVGERISRKSLGFFTEGTSTEQLNTLDRMSADAFSPNPAKNTDTGSNLAIEPFIKSVYSLGRDVFRIIDNVSEHVCLENELFRDDVTTPHEFDSARFATAIRELIVNAFCHGAWGAYEFGRGDNERMKATRIAVVHAGNRIEIINRLRESGHIWNRLGSETSARRSALHNAFVDINYACGRTIGLRLVRHRVTKLGLPSPIFVHNGNYHRAIIPVSFTLPGWCVFAERPKDYDRRILHFYTLVLAQFLVEIDEDILASAFYIRREEASDALMNLASMGALSRRTPDIIHHFQGYSVSDLPQYYLAGPADVASLIANLTDGMQFFSSPPQISLGGQYQLSARSMSLLVDADLRNWIHDLYAWEIVSVTEANKHTMQHMETLQCIESVRRRFR